MADYNTALQRAMFDKHLLTADDVAVLREHGSSWADEAEAHLKRRAPSGLTKTQVAAFVRGIAPVFKEKLQELRAQNEHLEARVAALEAANRKALHFRGAWTAGRYQPGDCTTHKGALWVALEDTAAKPGTPEPESRAWRLAVKSEDLR